MKQIWLKTSYSTFITAFRLPCRLKKKIPVPIGETAKQSTKYRNECSLSKAQKQKRFGG